jgi:hypothetical protein
MPVAYGIVGIKQTANPRMIPVIAPFLSLVAKKDSKKEVLIGQ